MTGHPGVNKAFPHVPGVDAAGIVVASETAEFVRAIQVIVTGFDMGANHWWLPEYVRVPWQWLVPLPRRAEPPRQHDAGHGRLHPGPACVDALQKPRGFAPRSRRGRRHRGQRRRGKHGRQHFGRPRLPGGGREWQNGFHDYLRSLGATQIFGREQVDDQSERPPLGPLGGGVDTVGGSILSTVLRSTRHSGCVAACGLAASNALPITVFPFILRP